LFCHTKLERKVLYITYNIYLHIEVPINRFCTAAGCSAIILLLICDVLGEETWVQTFICAKGGRHYHCDARRALNKHVYVNDEIQMYTAPLTHTQTHTHSSLGRVRQKGHRETDIRV